MFPLELRTSKQINAWHPDCQIIYITNYTNYFTSVYETSHIYYILKKDIDTYLSTALKKAIQQIAKINQYYLIIQSKQQHIRIAQSKILYLERIMRTTNIHTAEYNLSDTRKDGFSFRTFMSLVLSISPKAIS